jgi:hypothetical protein
LIIDGTNITANGNVSIIGDLLVQGTQSIFNTEQFSVENNIIELNTAGVIRGGILVGDITAPSELSGSLLWDGTSDYWIAGISGSEEKIILESEFTSYTSSTDNRVSSLETESGSIRTEFNSYTSSADQRLGSLETDSGSIRTDFTNYTSSTDSRLDSLEIESGSIRTELNSYTSSADLRIESLESESSSIRSDFNNYTSSTDTRVGDLENFSSSLDAAFATDAELEVATSSIISTFNDFTSSTDIRITDLENFSSSLDDTFTTDTELEAATSSIIIEFNNFTSSIDTTIKNKLNDDNIISGSFNDISQNPFISSSGAISASGDLVPSTNELYDLGSPSLRWKDLYLSGSTLYLGETKITRTEQGDIEFRDSQTENLRKIRVDELEIGVGESARRIKVENGTVKFVDSTNVDRTIDALGFEGIVTSSTQLLFTEISGVPVGLVSASSQIDLTQTKNFTTGIKSRLNVEGVLTSSSQLTELGFVKNDYTASTNVRLTSIENTTSSLDTRLSAVEIESGSIRTALNNYTSSTDNRLSSLETESGSIRTAFNNYIGSIDTAISIDGKNIVANGNVSVTGNLIVQGTQSIFNTEQFSVENNIIELNVGGTVKGGILVGDITAPSELSGSLLWDGLNDHWVAGISGSEQKIVLDGSFSAYTSSTDSKISSLETESGSIRTVFNNFTGSSGVVSSSVQIDHNTTTNYVTNQHIDHSTVNISAGNGLTGGGTIDATRTLTLDTGSTHFTGGIKTKLSAEAVVSSSTQVTSLLPAGLVSSSEGTITATSFVGNLSGTASLATTADITTYTAEWILGAVGSSHYTFTGPGFNGAVSAPTLYLIRGQQYKFTNTMGAHPFRIQSTPNGSAGTQYNDGVINNDVSNGTLTWNVQFNTPSLLYYQCSAHSGMGGKIYIIDAGIGPDTSINTTGTITATSFVETSTVKLKKNIIPLENQTEILQKLNPVRFTWKDSERDDIGLIAEEVAELYPELVEYDENNNVTGINYSRLTVILIKTVKELITKINDK